MENSFKFAFFLTILLNQFFFVSMESGSQVIQEAFSFFDLPNELNLEIFKFFINDLVKTHRFFNKIKAKVLKLRLSSKEINNQLNWLFTEHYILDLAKQINENSVYPISSYQLAKALLGSEHFAEFKKKYQVFANQLGSELLDTLSIDPQAFITMQENDALIMANKIKELIIAGANLDFTNDESSILMEALSIGSIFPEIIKILIYGGANLNFIGPDGYTSVQHALWAGFVDLAKMLVRSGANPTIPADWGHVFLKKRKKIQVKDYR